MSKCRVSKRQTPRHFPIAIATNRVPQSFPANVLARNPVSQAHHSVRNFSFLEAGIIDEADVCLIDGADHERGRPDRVKDVIH